MSDEGKLVLKLTKMGSILIGESIEVTYIGKDGNGVRLAIKAPKNVKIRRNPIEQDGRSE